MPEREDPPGGMDVGPAGEEWEVWNPGGSDGYALVDLVNRVLDKGVVLTGEVTISVAGVDLVYLGLNAVLTSVATARETLGRRVGRDAVGGG
ncbi:MAG TPA: gas vesicle protein [Longimicrobiaceae bacterium]|nr:gas vesicle protein [Longimicrobiaceae bacterium]